MVKKIYKNVFINSTILFVIASILEMTLHELGHFIAAILVHAKEAVLHHNYVSDEAGDLPLRQIIFIKGAGPLVSLVIGMLFHLICSRQDKRNLLFLFNLYMSIFGYIGFFGYLLIAPFFTSGDTGYICFVLEFPIWLTISIAVAGGFILYLLMRMLVRFFVEMGTAEIADNKELRPPFISALIFYPLLAGIVITTLLNLPVPTTLSLIAPLCSPFTIMWPYGLALSKKFPVNKMNPDMSNIKAIHFSWVIIFILVIILNRLLVGGVSLN
jgi:hypothetical protein